MSIRLSRSLGALALVALLLGIASAAQASEVMLGSTGGTGLGTPTPGSIFLINQTDGTATYLDTPSGGTGVSGLATNAAASTSAVPSPAAGAALRSAHAAAARAASPATEAARATPPAGSV